MMVKPEASIDLRKDLLLEKRSEFEHQRKDLSESSMFSGEAKELEATVKAMMTKSDNLIHNGKAQMIKAYTWQSVWKGRESKRNKGSH